MNPLPPLPDRWPITDFYVGRDGPLIAEVAARDFAAGREVRLVEWRDRTRAQQAIARTTRKGQA